MRLSRRLAMRSSLYRSYRRWRRRWAAASVLGAARSAQRAASPPPPSTTTLPICPPRRVPFSSGRRRPDRPERSSTRVRS